MLFGSKSGLRERNLLSTVDSTLAEGEYFGPILENGHNFQGLWIFSWTELMSGDGTNYIPIPVQVMNVTREADVRVTASKS